MHNKDAHTPTILEIIHVLAANNRKRLDVGSVATPSRIRIRVKDSHATRDECKNTQIEAVVLVKGINKLEIDHALHFFDRLI